MFNYLLYILLAGFITLVMLVPFGFAAMYVYLSLRQMVIANREKSNFKKQGGIIALLLAISTMVLLFVLWLYIMQKIQII
jgi:hypothetical protein